MKRFSVLIAVLLGFTVCLAATACGGRLKAPSGFSVDEDYNLSWSSVEGARSYRIEIKPVGGEADEDSTRQETYSLSGLAEGNYEIRVMAVGGSQSDTFTSKWSDVYLFEKGYESGMLYTLINNNTEYRIQRVGSASGNVVIEDEYRGKPVTEIAERAFRATSKVESVVIGKNVRTIGDSAFYNCTGLVSVTIPESVISIGEKAFQGCNQLKEVSIPEGVSQLLPNTFAYCRALERVELGGVEVIGDSAFYECSALREVVFPESVVEIGTYAFSSADALERVTIGGNVERILECAFSTDAALGEIVFSPREEGKGLEIGEGAFMDCDALGRVELPAGTTALGDYAFASCDSLSDVTIPDSVTTVGLGAFNATKLYYDQLDSTGYVYADKWLVSTSPEVRAAIERINADTFRSDTVGIAARAFISSPKLSQVNLPASIKYLGDMVFYNCPEVYRFILAENGLKKIGYASFAYCGTLSVITLTEGLEEIGNYAFFHCTSIKNGAEYGGGLTIPQSVNRIGQNAFSETGLEADEYGVIYAGDWVVDYEKTPASSSGQQDSLLQGTVRLKDSVVGFADYAFYWGDTMQNLVGFNRVEHVGEGALALCTRLSVVNLNRSLTEIKPFTFYKCTSLFSVDLPTRLASIGDYAFYNCTRLNELNLTETRLTRVGSHAFYQCSGLQSLILNDGLEEIAPYAFYKTEITTLEIPDSVKTIGERAFGYTTLQEVTFGSGLEEIGMFAFRDNYALEKVHLPDSLKTVGEYAFLNCIMLGDLDLGNGVETIGRYAFANTAIENLVLPASVVSVGNSAFKYCRNLKTVTLLGQIAEIGENAFYGALASYPVPTFYLKGETVADWSGSWNSQFGCVLQNVVFSEEGYVSSVAIGEGSVLNANVLGGAHAPARAGYRFLGWATAEGSPEVVYGMKDLASVPAGTVLYAVWEEAPEETEPDEPQESDPNGEDQENGDAEQA